MSILFIPPGTPQTASARFRAYWVAEYMPDTKVIPCDQVTQADIDEADVLIWGKMLVQFDYHGQRMFWDICDPVHWFNPQVETRQWTDVCEKVITSSDGLTEDFNAWYGSEKAVTIPDRLKLEHYPKQRSHVHVDPIRLLWFGNNGNRWPLIAAMGDLIRLSYCGVRAELTICDDNPKDVWRVAEFPIYMVRWSLDTENNIYSSHDLAILPPMGGRQGLCKSNNKTITAWANGLPVFDGRESFDWLMRLCTEAELRQQVAFENYTNLERFWQVEKSAQEWMELIG